MLSPTPASALGLSTIPEELIERILAFALSPSSSTAPVASKAHGTSSSRTGLLLTSRALNRIGTPLLYSTLRINTARSARLLAQTLSGNGITTAAARAKELSSCVRAIIARASYPSIGVVFHACAGRTLELLDITVDAGIDGDGEKDKESGVMFGEALTEVDVKEFVLRKRGAYLTQERPKAVMTCLATAVLKWNSLETVTIAFRLSDSSRRFSLPQNFANPPTLINPPPPAAPSTSTSSPKQPLTLPYALSRSPKLHTLRAALPAVWNPALLLVSTNPSLQRIILTTSKSRSRTSSSPSASVVQPSQAAAAPHAPLPPRRKGRLGMGLGLLRQELEANGGGSGSGSGSDTDFEGPQVDFSNSFDTAGGSGSDGGVGGEAEEEVLRWGTQSGIHLWMMEARKHPRLVELIKAGSPGLRTRAHTLDVLGREGGYGTDKGKGRASVSVAGMGSVV